MLICQHNLPRRPKVLVIPRFRFPNCSFDHPPILPQYVTLRYTCQELFPDHADLVRLGQCYSGPPPQYSRTFKARSCSIQQGQHMQLSLRLCRPKHLCERQRV